ncbi:MAG: hypothetical protein HKN04_13230 [Rhodothermaceae bacterium]|nr:hypothetical protein [Rhodothermaceae bacterium]
MARIFLLIGLVCAASGAVAQGPAAPSDETPQVEVRAEGPVQAEAEAGGVSTVAFSVFNHADEPRRFRSTVTIPEGWQFVAPPVAFDVPAQGRALRLVSLRVPASAPPGPYAVRFVAQTQIQEQAEATLQVAVRPRYGVRLDLLEAPRYAVAGTPIALRFLLASTGNAAARVRLSLRATPFEGALDEEWVVLGAGEAKEVRVTVNTPPDLFTRTSFFYRLTADVEQAEASTFVEGQVLVIPGTERAQALQPSSPVSLRLTTLGGGASFGPQAEVEAAVPLSADSLHRAEVLLRSPAYGQSSFAEADVYQARYVGPQVEALLGDGIYSLTPLTAPGRFGTGAGATASFGRVEAQAFFRGNRRAFFPQTQGGASVRYDADRLGAYTLSATAGSGEAAGAATSLRAEVHTHEALGLDVEVGVAGHEQVAGAISVAAAGKSGETRYQARFDHVGPDHPSYTSGLDSRGVGVSTRLAQDLSFTASFRDDRRWMRESGATTENSLFSLALSGHRRARQRTLHGSIGIEQAAYQQSFGSVRLDREQLLLRLRGGLVIDDLRASAMAEVARVTDQLTGTPMGSQRLLLEMSMQQGTRQGYAQLDVQQGASLYLFQSGRRWVARAGGREQLGRLQLALDLGGGVDQSSAASYPFGAAWVHVGYALPRGMQLRHEVRAQLVRVDRATLNTNYRLTLDVPIAAPSPIRFRSPLLEGRVVDESTGLGVPGVLVHLGDESALTEPDGRFVFPRPATGTHYLHLDRVSLGMERVPAVPMPFLIDVPAEGAIPEIRIPVTRRTQLSGRVRVLDIHGTGLVADTMEVTRPLMAVVEATSGSHRVRRLCTRDGRFSFEDLPPGEWTVRLIQSDVPETYRLEEEAVVVTVTDQAIADLRFLPRQRRITFIGSGRLGSD